VHLRCQTPRGHADRPVSTPKAWFTLSLGPAAPGCATQPDCTPKVCFNPRPAATPTDRHSRRRRGSPSAWGLRPQVTRPNRIARRRCASTRVPRPRRQTGIHAKGVAHPQPGACGPRLRDPTRLHAKGVLQPASRGHADRPAFTPKAWLTLSLGPAAPGCATQPDCTPKVCFNPLRPSCQSSILLSRMVVTARW